MKTSVTFKVLTGDRRTKTCTLKIEHPEFTETPPCKFHGVDLPAVTVGEKVIQWLDSIDKFQMMIDHDWYLIIDYWIKPQVKRKPRGSEIHEFCLFLDPYVEKFPQLKRPFEAIISDYGHLLFGHKKTDEQKLKLLLELYEMTKKVSDGAIDMVVSSLEKTLGIDKKQSPEKFDEAEEIQDKLLE